MRVEDIMTRAVLTVRPTTTVHDASVLMTGNGVTLLPVVAGETLVGVVDEADVLRGRMPPTARPGVPARGLAPPRVVSEVMTRDVTVLRPTLAVVDAVSLILDRGLRSLPVVRNGELVGIVTRRDVVRALTRSDDDLQHAVGRRLDVYAGCHRWRVHADRGAVTLCDEYDDPVEQHIASVIAAAVPGAVRVDTYRRDQCPRHRHDVAA